MFWLQHYHMLFLHLGKKRTDFGCDLVGKPQAFLAEVGARISANINECGICYNEGSLGSVPLF